MTDHHTQRYLVWNMSRGFPTCSHATIETAIKESERLAKLNPGETFHVMASIGAATVEKPAVFRLHKGVEKEFGSARNFETSWYDGIPF